VYTLSFLETANDLFLGRSFLLFVRLPQEMRRSRVFLGPSMLVDGYRLRRVTSLSNIGRQVECISHGNFTRFAVLSDAPTRFKPGDASEWLFSPSFYH
jgi:hypothetical protein